MSRERPVSVILPKSEAKDEDVIGGHNPIPVVSVTAASRTEDQNYQYNQPQMPRIMEDPASTASTVTFSVPEVDEVDGGGYNPKLRVIRGALKKNPELNSKMITE